MLELGLKISIVGRLKEVTDPESICLAVDQTLNERNG